MNLSKAVDGNPWNISASCAAALDAMCAAGSVKGAARLIHKSPETIEGHMQNAKRRMGTINRVQALVTWTKWRVARNQPTETETA
jgi:hypothetical protein